MVWTGAKVRGAKMVAAPIMLTGKAFKAPGLKLPMGGSPFMMQIRGFQAAARGMHFAMLPKKTMITVHKAIEKIGRKILRSAQDTCPVGETMMLASSGRFVDNSVVVSGDVRSGVQFINMRITFGGGSTGVDYAVYVHEGHSAPDGSWVRGRPWLVRAARRHERALLRAAKYSALGVWNAFVRQVNTGSAWQAVGMGAGMRGTPSMFGGGKYGTGAGQGWKRMLGGTGPVVG